MKNLVGGGNKKIKDVEDIGQFNTKYKAHDKSKHILTKQAKESGEHLLKLNNSKAGGIDQAEYGFFMIFKAGERI